MNFPDNLKYTKEHEWLRLEGKEAFVGVTEYATSELGDIVFVEIETEGESLGKGDSFGTVEAVKTVSDLFMPVAGKVKRSIQSWLIIRRSLMKILTVKAG